MSAEDDQAMPAATSQQGVDSGGPGASDAHAGIPASMREAAADAQLLEAVFGPRSIHPVEINGLLHYQPPYTQRCGDTNSATPPTYSNTTIRIKLVDLAARISTAVGKQQPAFDVGSVWAGSEYTTDAAAMLQLLTFQAQAAGLLPAQFSPTFGANEQVQERPSTGTCAWPSNSGRRCHAGASDHKRGIPRSNAAMQGYVWVAVPFCGQPRAGRKCGALMMVGQRQADIDAGVVAITLFGQCMHDSTRSTGCSQPAPVRRWLKEMADVVGLSQTAHVLRGQVPQYSNLDVAAMRRAILTQLLSQKANILPEGSNSDWDDGCGIVD